MILKVLENLLLQNWKQCNILRQKFNNVKIIGNNNFFLCIEL